MKSSILRLTIGMLGTTLLFCPAANAQREDEQAPVKCVDLRRIDHTEIVGDQTILFYMKNRTIYRNLLPHACPGLEREERFMYRVSLSQLCNVDVVSVLEDWGFGFTQGPSCMLGMFQPISPETADELKADQSSRRTRTSD
jgi:hypothetical protein